MKIVSWNCNGALRTKYNYLKDFEADIYIVQECENPAECKDTAYKEWAGNYLWIGDNKNKGIGVFTNRNIDLKKLDWSDNYKDHRVKYFLPCLINDSTQLLAVWTHRNDSPNFGYIGQLWKYLEVNIDNLNNVIIAGDLNSNARWDQWDRWWNHSDVVKTLKNRNIESVYHSYTNELQGQETTPTFYLHRKLDRPYHIDYFFVSKTMLIGEYSVAIPDKDAWLKYSDHVPVVLSLTGPV